MVVSLKAGGCGHDGILLCTNSEGCDFKMSFYKNIFHGIFAFAGQWKIQRVTTCNKSPRLGSKEALWLGGLQVNHLAIWTPHV